MTGVRLLPLVVLLLGLLPGCSMPRDPRDTLVQVRGDTLRVGYMVDPPWVTGGSSGPAGVEPTLLRSFAREVEAEIAWVAGTEQELMERLADYELDIVVGGITRTNAWGRRVALTVPYYGEDHDLRHQHVMAVPPGENLWLVTLERFLRLARPAAAHLVAEVAP